MSPRLILSLKNSGRFVLAFSCGASIPAINHEPLQIIMLKACLLSLGALGLRHLGNALGHSTISSHALWDRLEKIIATLLIVMASIVLVMTPYPISNEAMLARIIIASIFLGGVASILIAYAIWKERVTPH